MLAFSTVGFAIAEKASEDHGFIGLGLGALIGLIVLIIILRFVSYRLKAGQIAMITYGITEGELPDDVIRAGKQVVKDRFATVAAYFAITGAIRGIFNQLGNTITKTGQKIGGDTGGAVGSAVSSAISTVVSYLCSCCRTRRQFRWSFRQSAASLSGPSATPR